MTSKKIWVLWKETIKKFISDKVPKLAAALSFYTVFASAPLLIFVIAIAGLVLDRAAAQGKIVGEIQDLIGTEGAKLLESMVLSASKPEAGIIASIVGFVALILGATGVFVELKDSLNIIWEVPPSHRNTGLTALVRERFLSLAMIMGVGFMLLVSLAVSAVLAGFSDILQYHLPGMQFFMGFANFLISMGVVSALFAMMFKFLPDSEIEWSDVAIGSTITAFLFVIGKALIGLYLGRGAVTSIYGAAGSLAILFLWVYYSAQIFFLGAEFIWVYTKRHGSRRRQTESPSQPATPPGSNARVS